MSAGLLAQITWMKVPLAMMALVLHPPSMEPLKGPCTESRRSRLARFSRSRRDRRAPRWRAGAGVGGAGALDEQTGQQAADAAEAVEHHVGRGGHGTAVQGRCQLGAQIVPDAGFILVILPVAHGQFAEIDFGGGGGVQGRRWCAGGEVLLDGQRGALVAANDPVGLEDTDGGGVLQRASVEGDLYPLLSVEATIKGLHGFGELLALLPRLQVVLVGH